MQKQTSSVKKTHVSSLQQLLRKLSLTSVEQLLTIDRLDKSTSSEYLTHLQLSQTIHQIHNIAVCCPMVSLAERRGKAALLKMDGLIGSKSRKFWGERVQVGRVIELTGKPNSGKTLFCYEAIKEGLKAGVQVVCLDSGGNFTEENIAHLLKQESLEDKAQSIKVIPFTTIRSLGISLHSLGSHLLSLPLPHPPTLLLLDSLSTCLSRLQHQPQTHCFSELKRLFSQLTNKLPLTIIYTTMSRANLYETTHQKTEEIRFRCRHPRIWDGLADTTLVLDSALVMDDSNKGRMKRLMRGCLTKGVEDEAMGHFQTRLFN